MPQQLIIVVHGMGTHPKGETLKTFKKALTDSARRFGIASTDFLKQADYKEFNYSEYFDTIRQQFADNAQARRKGFAYLAGKGFEEQLLNQLTQFEANFGKDAFFYTHWLDVILYSTTYFGEKLRLDFIKQFDKLIEKYDHKNTHVVCHSLGTAVVHDAFAKYYRSDSVPFDDVPDRKTGDFNIASLWTFANVSRLVNVLNDLQDPYASSVVTGSEGCSEDFVNVRHKYDPFTWFKTYDRTMANKVTFTTTAIRKVNTHDFYEYVTEPRVSRAMLQYLYDLQIDDAAFQTGDTEYKKTSLKAEVKPLRDAVDAARADPSIDSVQKAVAEFKKIFARIDELKASLESEP